MPTAFEKVMDSRKELVNKVIKLMEEGYHHNQSLWSTKAIFPNNPESNVVYRDGNQLRLMIAAMENNFEDPRWMTFRQMAKAGYHLKDVHQSVLCEKWIFTEKKKQISENGKEEIVEVPLEKPKVAYFYVFNASQIEGYPKMEYRELPEDLNEPVIRTRDGKQIKTYLYSLVDDHSRYIMQSEFYDNMRQEIVEDTFHKAMLKHGRFDCTYLDNGTQYTSNQLETACAKLGIRVLHAKPRALNRKGKSKESFHDIGYQLVIVKRPFLVRITV